jgi:hypothetical protein
VDRVKGKTMKNDNEVKQALGSVFDAIISEYDEQRKQDDAWKDLFNKVDGLNFKPLLREAARKMETVALDTYSLIEDELARVGKKPNRDIFNAVYALSYLENALTRDIKKKESFACSVDKAFYILNKYVNEQALSKGEQIAGE